MPISWINKIRKNWKSVGPGLITGAADDDPSGIATYSIAGAQFGYRLNWMTFFLLPAMIAIQEMCGRVGMVSGKGLASVIKKYESKRVLYLAVGLLLVANTINIAADLGIIAACAQMILGFPYYYWLIISAVFICWMEIGISYRKYSGVLKWLGLILLVYMATALLVKQDWGEILKMTLIPHLKLEPVYFMTVVGFFGTTISPYLFFWQASEEVEEEIEKKEIKDFGIGKPEFKKAEIKSMEKDTIIGMVFSNLMTFFIVLTTAATLHKNGIYDIETPQQAAQALKPLAGNLAYLLFALGIIGTGWQSIPVLAGSAAYAVADTFGLREGLSKSFSKAKSFYLVITTATIIGVLLNLFHINTMKALYYAAVFNGVASVPLIAIIIKLADNEKIVGKYKTKKGLKIIAWLTFGFALFSLMLMGWSLIGAKI